MTTEELLKIFPEYRPTVFYVDADNRVIPQYTYWDRMELEGMLLDRENGARQQKELFLL